LVVLFVLPASPIYINGKTERFPKRILLIADLRCQW